MLSLLQIQSGRLIGPGNTPLTAHILLGQMQTLGKSYTIAITNSGYACLGAAVCLIYTAMSLVNVHKE